MGAAPRLAHTGPPRCPRAGAGFLGLHVGDEPVVPGLHGDSPGGPDQRRAGVRRAVGGQAADLQGETVVPEMTSWTADDRHALYGLVLGRQCGDDLVAGTGPKPARPDEAPRPSTGREPATGPTSPVERPWRMGWRMARTEGPGGIRALCSTSAWCSSSYGPAPRIRETCDQQWLMRGSWAAAKRRAYGPHPCL